MQSSLFDNAIHYLRHSTRAPVEASEFDPSNKLGMTSIYLINAPMPIAEAFIIQAAACMIDPRAHFIHNNSGAHLLGFTPVQDKLPLRQLRANVEYIRDMVVRAINQTANGNYFIMQTPQLGTLNMEALLKVLSDNSPRIHYYRQLPRGVTAVDADQNTYRGIVRDEDFQKIISACGIDGSPFDFSEVRFHHALVPADIMQSLIRPLGIADEHSPNDTTASMIARQSRMLPPLPKNHLDAIEPVVSNLFQKAVDTLDYFSKKPVGHETIEQDGKLLKTNIYDLDLPRDWDQATEMILAAALHKVAPLSTVEQVGATKVRVHLGLQHLPLRQMQLEIGNIQRTLKLSGITADDGSMIFLTTPELHDYHLEPGLFFTALIGSNPDVSVFLKIPPGMVVTDESGNRYTTHIEHSLLDKATTNYGPPSARDFTFSHIMIPPHVWRQINYKLGMHSDERGTLRN